MENNVESTYVTSFYNRNAREFSETRTRPWPTTKRFIEENLYRMPLILDNGCGNGRSMICDMVGLDTSVGLLECAKHRNTHALINGTGLNLPFCDGSFDLVLSIAVIHHVSTVERRETSVREIARVMSDNAQVLIYVWAECKVDQKKIVGSPQGAIAQNDVLIGWKNSVDSRRYYHLFKPQELEELVTGAGLVIVESGIENENYYVVAAKHAS